MQRLEHRRVGTALGCALCQVLNPAIPPFAQRPPGITLSRVGRFRLRLGGRLLLLLPRLRFRRTLRGRGWRRGPRRWLGLWLGLWWPLWLRRWRLCLWLRRLGRGLLLSARTRAVTDPDKTEC